MIKSIIDLLQIDDFYGVSKDVDFAKGINSRPNSFKEMLLLWKRHWKRNK